MPKTPMTLRQLMYLGGHLGHSTYAKENGAFLYGKRNGHYIINLEKTLANLRLGYQFVQEVCRQSGSILFVVGVQQPAIRTQIEQAGHLVISRWTGGLFTNFQETYHVLQKSRTNQGTKRHLPDLVILFEKNLFAIKELRQLNIPVISIVDTTTSVRDILYPIPSNDASDELTQVYVTSFVTAINESRLLDKLELLRVGPQVVAGEVAEVG